MYTDTQTNMFNLFLIMINSPSVTYTERIHCQHKLATLIVQSPTKTAHGCHNFAHCYRRR